MFIFDLNRNLDIYLMLIVNEIRSKPVPESRWPGQSRPMPSWRAPVSVVLIVPSSGRSSSRAGRWKRVIRSLMLRLFSLRKKEVHRLAEAPSGSRLYVIGDIHGRLDLLLRLYDRIVDDAWKEPDGDRRVF